MKKVKNKTIGTWVLICLATYVIFGSISPIVSGIAGISMIVFGLWGLARLIKSKN